MRMRKRDVVIVGVLAVVIATTVVLINFGCHFNDTQDDCPGDWIAQAWCRSSSRRRTFKPVRRWMP